MKIPEGTAGYRALALYLITALNRGDLKRLMKDDVILLRLLRKECRALDYNGPVLDAISEICGATNKVFWMRAQIDSLADSLFKAIDVDKLRLHISLIDPDL